MSNLVDWVTPEKVAEMRRRGHEVLRVRTRVTVDFTAHLPMSNLYVEHYGGPQLAVAELAMVDVRRLICQTPITPEALDSGKVELLGVERWRP